MDEKILEAIDKITNMGLVPEDFVAINNKIEECKLKLQSYGMDMNKIPSIKINLNLKGCVAGRANNATIFINVELFKRNYEDYMLIKLFLMNLLI